MYTRQQCDQLKGDYFPRSGDCLYEGGSFGKPVSRLSEQPYFLMLGGLGVAMMGWYFLKKR